MPVSAQSLAGGQPQSFDALAKSIAASMRVSMPGIIESFDPKAVTCVVRPAILGAVQDESGNYASKELPLLVDVPVVFPRGGGFSITFPVKKGDECLVVFSDRCIDFWWQSGGVQEAVDPRQHDLSDAFALIGPQSQKEKISGISIDSLQIRTDDKQSMIELNSDGNIMIIAPRVIIRGDVSVQGEISSTGDQVAGGKISQLKHVHGGVQSGGSSTGVPQ